MYTKTGLYFLCLVASCVGYMYPLPSRRDALILTTSLFLPQKHVCIIGSESKTAKKCAELLQSLHHPVKYDILEDSKYVIYLEEGLQSLENTVHYCLKNRIQRLVYVSASCRSCDTGQDSDTDKMSGLRCNVCKCKQEGEHLIRSSFRKTRIPNVDYTIIRTGFQMDNIFTDQARGVAELEINQDYTKSGIISSSDLAELCINAANHPKTASTTFEAYYRDTAQPYDIQESLNKCTGNGKSVEECFFGSEFRHKKPQSLEEVQKTPLKGSLFSTGAETTGESYDELFKTLIPDSAKII